MSDGKTVGDFIADCVSPLADEMRRLRRRLAWRPVNKPPKHQNPVLVSVKGDMFFACWRPPEGADEGYWDSDIEYGGKPIQPDAWFDVPPINQTALYDNTKRGRQEAEKERAILIAARARMFGGPANG